MVKTIMNVGTNVLEWNVCQNCFCVCFQNYDIFVIFALPLSNQFYNMYYET